MMAFILLGFFIGYNLSRFANGLEISIDGIFIGGAIATLVSTCFAFKYLAEMVSSDW